MVTAIILGTLCDRLNYKYILIVLIVVQIITSIVIFIKQSIWNEFALLVIENIVE